MTLKPAFARMRAPLVRKTAAATVRSTSGTTHFSAVTRCDCSVFPGTPALPDGILVSEETGTERVDVVDALEEAGIDAEVDVEVDVVVVEVVVVEVGGMRPKLGASCRDMASNLLSKKSENMSSV